MSFLRASLSRPPKMTRNLSMEQRAWAARGVGTPRFNCIGLDHVFVAVNVKKNTYLIFSKICSRLRIQNLIHVPLAPFQCYTDIVLCMHSANERWRYTVTPSLIGWVHTQNDPCYMHLLTNTNNRMGHGQHLKVLLQWNSTSVYTSCTYSTYHLELALGTFICHFISACLVCHTS